MILCLFLAFLAASTPVSTSLYHKRNIGTHTYYVLHHDPSYASLADAMDMLGLEAVKPVGELEGIWLARKLGTDDSRRSEDDPVIETYRRMRRGTLVSRKGRNVSLSVKHLSRDKPRRLARKAHSEKILPQNITTLEKRVDIPDPLFKEQWSLQSSDNPDTSLNVIPVWEKNYTGKGVIIAVLDDGIMSNHLDIMDNYAEEFSYDFVRDNAKPGVDAYDHGTASAGIIAAAKNDICGIGIAYGAKVADLRLLTKDESMTSYADEAEALNHKMDDISVYSISYGAEDDGSNIDQPSYIANKALLNGVNNGRKLNGEGRGKGSIYVVTAGNDAAVGDGCDYNNFANSIYTITIGALNDAGRHAPYSERCAALMAVTYGGGRPKSRSKSIVTIGNDSNESCGKFWGTSAAAPAAAAIFALALEARPKLTWRDIQYLCVTTARLIDDGFWWSTLPSGRKYSPYLGFGVLDADAFVTAAEDWELVKPQVWMKLPYITFDNASVNREGEVTGGTPLSHIGVWETIHVTEEMVKEHDFSTIEHIQVRVWVQHERRGDVLVTLIGKNTTTVLSTDRPHDEATTGLMGRTFMTVKYWGEDPVGLWYINVSDQFDPDTDSEKKPVPKGKILGISLTFWGCAKDGKQAVLYEMPPDDNNIFPPPS